MQQQGSCEGRRFYPVRNNAPLLPPGQLPAHRALQLGQRPSGPAAAAGLDFSIIPAGFNAPPVESLWVERLEFLTGFTGIGGVGLHRAEETDVLTNLEIKSLIAGKHIRLTNYRELLKLHKRTVN